MKQQGGDRSPKATWFVVFAAFIWLEVLVVAFGAYMAHNYSTSGRPAPGAEALQALAYVITPLAVVAAIYWARAKLAPSVKLTAAEFTRNSIVALAIAELGLMFGVVAFMRTDPMRILLFGVVTLVVDFAIILPTGVRYWNAPEA